jgi:hypothetical protein
MSQQVVKRFPFLDGDRHQGAVEIVRRTSHGSSTVGLQLRKGNQVVQLPWNKLEQVVSALEQGKQEASAQYKAILEEMNR